MLSMKDTLPTLERCGAEGIAELENYVDCQLSGRVHEFHLRLGGDGLVLSGRAATYYAKQLAQHLVMQASDLPIRANDIVVT
jgi:hypothetical protein